MTIEKHDLLHEFPESKEAIHELKLHDNHFSRLFSDYHDVTHEVHRIETGAENTSDSYLEAKKKERLQLKDTLFSMIKSHENAAS